MKLLLAWYRITMVNKNEPWQGIRPRVSTKAWRKLQAPHKIGYTVFVSSKLNLPYFHCTAPTLGMIRFYISHVILNFLPR